MNITLDSNTIGAAATEATNRSKLADAAQQFEAMMLQELLKPLRSSEDDLSGEKSEDGSFDTLASFGTESVAKSISQHGGLGIARQVIQQLSAHVKDGHPPTRNKMPIQY
jgi:Rod binding domain-containing protein